MLDSGERGIRSFIKLIIMIMLMTNIICIAPFENSYKVCLIIRLLGTQEMSHKSQISGSKSIYGKKQLKNVYIQKILLKALFFLFFKHDGGGLCFFQKELLLVRTDENLLFSFFTS